MEAVNTAIRGLSEADPTLFYADVATPMLGPDAGIPPDTLFLKDGLHLSDEGYALWVRHLRPVLDEALAAR